MTLEEGRSFPITDNFKLELQELILCNFAQACQGASAFQANWHATSAAASSMLYHC
jgi:hypothetical protein